MPVCSIIYARHVITVRVRDLACNSSPTVKLAASDTSRNNHYCAPSHIFFFFLCYHFGSRLLVGSIGCNVALLKTNDKMRLFRRRTDGQHQLHEPSSSGAAASAALLVSMESSTDGDPLIASRSERETLDDNNYQTVKAVPAIVVINSPKVHKSKGQLELLCFFPFLSLRALTRQFSCFDWRLTKRRLGIYF